MIKLYLFYFLYGLYIFYITLFYWGFSAGPANIWPYITLLSSTILFTVASVLSLFYPKPAAVIGLVSLVGTSIFSIHLMGDISWSYKIISSIALLMFVVYLAGLFYSVTTLINYDKVKKTNQLKRPTKLILASVPISLFLFFVINILIRL